MSAAVAAILEGMPEPRDLRMHQADGWCVISAGSVVLFEYGAADTAMRNIALAALRQLGIHLSPRTCGRILALNRALGLPQPAAPPPHEPRPMPFAAFEARRGRA